RELALFGAARSPRLHEHALAVELGHARVAVAVRDEDVPRRVPPDVGRPAEHVALRAGARCAAASSSAAGVSSRLACRRGAAGERQRQQGRQCLHLSTSFCTRHDSISPTTISFGLRQSIMWTTWKPPNSLLGWPNLPSTVPSSSIL